jgi:hypothetical protein
VPTEKTSATLDAKLLSDVRKRVGRRGLSSFINQAVAEKLQRERVIELLDALDDEHGKPSPAERKAAQAALATVFRGA